MPYVFCVVAMFASSSPQGHGMPWKAMESSDRQTKINNSSGTPLAEFWTTPRASRMGLPPQMSWFNGDWAFALPETLGKC